VGGILADEMGLGKTIQVCVFLRSVAESRQESRIFKSVSEKISTNK
jgi:SNF2 family DNA or RNA helicase